MKQPCDRNCPRRCPGCAVSCPDWAAYLREREEEYKRRLAEAEVTSAVIDGRVRCGKILMN